MKRRPKRPDRPARPDANDAERPVGVPSIPPPSVRRARAAGGAPKRPGGGPGSGPGRPGGPKSGGPKSSRPRAGGPKSGRQRPGGGPGAGGARPGGPNAGAGRPDRRGRDDDEAFFEGAEAPRRGPGGRGERPRAGGPPKGPGGRAAGPKPGGPPKFGAVELSRVTPQVAPAGLLAEVTASIGVSVRDAVLGAGQRADRLIANAMRQRRDLALSDHRFLSAAIASWFRWRGWVEPMDPNRFEAQLLFANLLDATSVHPACRAWARTLGRDPDRLIALGDAPDWTAKTEGFKRLVGGQPVTVDPWRLFPDWVRPLVPLPPGDGPPKARFVRLIEALQTPGALWVRAQAADPEPVWNELRSLGLKPWVHRRLGEAARLERDADLPHVPAYERGLLEVQDLASQAVGRVCDPEPGERWWDACAGAGGKSLHLAALMQGKGVVVASDIHTRRLQEAVRRARRSPYRNVTTREWDGKHAVGKSGTYAGVLVDAPCSGLGTWRRNPESRWTLEPEAVDRLAALQGQLLHTASAGVKPGGLLVYSVCTFTPAETRAVATAFLQAHPGFKLDPFPHPITGAETDGTLQIWPHEFDSDAMFIARFVRTP